MASPDPASRGGPPGSPFEYASLGTAVIHRTLRPSAGDPFADDEAALRQPACLRAQGRGKYLPSRLEGCTLLASLRGSLEVDSADGVFHLPRRHFLCLPNGSLSRVRAGRHSDWMALRLPQPYLARIFRSRILPALSPPLLLPASLPLTRPLMRLISELLRTSTQDVDAGKSNQVIALLLVAVNVQTESTDWARRAYGRSERHRRAVLVRLLSARNRIINAPFMPHDLNSLAAAARYSPSHFLRSFRDVFGMTPHELLTESRMAMACELIRGSDLAICDIASSVGYESRHAFSRLFKRETGSTASDFRCLSAAATRG